MTRPWPCPVSSKLFRCGGFEGKDSPLLLDMFHGPRLCLQPPGDGPTRRSFLDAILADQDWGRTPCNSHGFSSDGDP